MSAMTEEQRNELPAIKFKMDQGTATTDEVAQYEFLFEEYSCDA